MKKPHTLTLCMIVKNEADNIKATIENVVEKFGIDYWIISDTGSTDNTIEVIKDTFDKLKIPGYFHNKDWKDFSTNRNYVIEEAEHISEYLLFFDADDTVVGNFKLPKLTHDSYLMKFGPNFVFHRIFIVKTNHIWRYKGILHEYISCDFPYPSKVTITGDYYVVPGTHGCRSKDPNKYLNDALVFEKALISDDTPNVFKGRYNYYCAQSYKDANRMDRAIDFYKKTIDENGWTQEKYIACQMLGEYYKKTDINNAIKYFTLAEKYDSTRVECVMGLSDLFDNDIIKLSILTSIPYETVANPISSNYLFIDTPRHNVYYFNSVIILAYKLGKQDIVCDYLNEQLTRFKNIHTNHLHCVLNNVELCLNNYTNNKLIDIYSTVNRILFSNEINYNKKDSLHQLGKQKMRDIVCNRKNIPINLLYRNSTKPIDLIFSIENSNIDNFRMTVYSFINCFQDSHLIQDFYVMCNSSQLEAIRTTLPQFNFIKSISYNDTKYKQNDYTIYLDCNHYFYHKEFYLDTFFKKLHENNSCKIAFEKENNNYIIDNNSENDKVINMSFEIVANYKDKNALVEVDVDFSKIVV